MNHWNIYVVAYFEIVRFSIFYLGGIVYDRGLLVFFIEYSWGLIFSLLVDFRILFGGIFLIWLVIDFPYRHTVSLGCMHAVLPFRLRGEGTLVPGARPSLWRGDGLSFVISSPVPSIRFASVANGYVRESGRCCCGMAILPLFLSCVYSPLFSLKYTFVGILFIYFNCMHKV